jgi:hypothetical protein
VSIVPLWLYWLGELAYTRVRDGAPAHAPMLAPRAAAVSEPARMPRPAAPRASASVSTASPQ